MTTLTAGSSYSFTMDPHAKLTLVVPGKATLAFTSASNNLRSSFTVSNAQSKTYGPFGAIGTMVITSVDQALEYTVTPGVPMLSSDGLSLVSGDGILIPVVGGLSATNSAAAATANVTKLQAALTAGGLVQILAPGTYYINDRLVIGSNTDLVLGAGVFIKQFVGSNKPLLVTDAYENGAGESVTIAWSAGRIATVTWTNHGLTTRNYAVFTGAAQYAYNTIAKVQSVVDANTFTVLLQRTPSAAATGTILGWRCTENFSVTGGVFDYDYTNNSVVTVELDRFSIIIGRAANFRLSKVSSINAYKYCFNIGAVMDYNIVDCVGDGTQSGSSSEALKTYGPARNGVVDNLSGRTTDDFASIQASEDSAFLAYRWTQGDIVNLRHSNFRGASNAGTAIVPIYLDDNYITDDIKIENLWGQTTGTTADSCNIFCLKKNPNVSVGIFGTIEVDGVDGSTIGTQSYGASLQVCSGNVLRVNGVVALAARQVHGFSGLTAKKLEITNCLRNVTTDTNSSIYLNAPVVKHLSINGNVYTQTAASTAYGAEVIAGTVDDIDFIGNTFDGATNVRGLLLYTLGTVRAVRIQGNHMRSSGDRILELNGATSVKLIGRDNEFDASILFAIQSAAAACAWTAIVEGNIATANSNGFFRITQTTNANTGTIRSANNEIANAAHITVVSGTPTLEVYGWDMKIDPIALTGLAGTVGQFCTSTQAANEGGLAVRGNVNGTPAWYSLAGAAAGANAAIT